MADRDRLIIDRTKWPVEVSLGDTRVLATDAAAQAVARIYDAECEAHARDLALRSLRPGLRWLVDHPRLLDWAYHLRLARRPVMRTYPDGRVADVVEADRPRLWLVRWEESDETPAVVVRARSELEARRLAAKEVAEVDRDLDLARTVSQTTAIELPDHDGDLGVVA